MDDLESQTNQQLGHILWDELSRVEGLRFAKAADPYLAANGRVVWTRVAVRRNGALELRYDDELSGSFAISLIRTYRCAPGR